MQVRYTLCSIHSNVYLLNSVYTAQLATSDGIRYNSVFDSNLAMMPPDSVAGPLQYRGWSRIYDRTGRSGGGLSIFVLHGRLPHDLATILGPFWFMST